MNGTDPDRFSDRLSAPDVTAHILPDDGTYPNNERLPVLVYRQAVRPAGESPARVLEQIFQAHDWTGTWRNGIFSYHHYHSTAHEVLGIAHGGASVQLGGPDGLLLDVRAGDVFVLPAGVAHKNCGADGEFLVVGAYPAGQQWDLKRGKPEDRPVADRNIEAVSLPETDPVYGAQGPLLERWGGA